jgi:hypothetical protein
MATDRNIEERVIAGSFREEVLHGLSIREMGYVCCETYQRNSDPTGRYLSHNDGYGAMSDIVSGLRLHGDQHRIFKKGWDACLEDMRNGTSKRVI